ncbi:alpha/beta fold hydrolase [Sphingomonas sp. 1P08PE]|uniref:alpha/beta fold hydrolase n=1 Tax=Sphingomonas sp. 1P08PE TaxID=554122 RepID=UPI0039A1C722
MPMNLHGPLARRHNLHVLGSGGEIVVFGHGLGTDQSAWRDFASGLDARYTALLFDLPGAGPLLPDGFDPDDYRSLSPFADDVLDLLEEVGVEACTYVGHSVAGMIGVLAAIEAPALFDRLILLNASPRYLNDADYEGGFDRADLEGLLGTMAANYQAWVAGFAPMAIGAAAPSAVEEFSAGLLAMRPDVTLRVARTIFESDVRPLLPALTRPTFLVHSRTDVAVPPAVGRYLHAHIADSRLMWIDAEGHLPHLSAPAIVRAALDEALRA